MFDVQKYLRGFFFNWNFILSFTIFLRKSNIAESKQTGTPKDLGFTLYSELRRTQLGSLAGKAPVALGGSWHRSPKDRRAYG